MCVALHFNSARTARYKLEFHDVDTDTDTHILARILARKLRVSDVMMYRRVGRDGVESVSVSVSAPWNASYTAPHGMYTASGVNEA